jgi:hypothetical protein
LSVSVSAGATVIESPVWTPIGSTFSIEQMMMAVVRAVAHHLHLIFLPAEHRFLDQHLGGRGGVEPAGDDLEELLAVVGDAAAGAAQREARPDDRREPDLEQRDERFAAPSRSSRLCAIAERGLSSPIFHRVAELLPVLGLLDRLGIGADQLDAVAGPACRP